MIWNKDVFLCVLILFLVQVVVWFQLIGQLKWTWFNDNWLVLSLLGIPISYLLILSTK